MKKVFFVIPIILVFVCCGNRNDALEDTVAVDPLYEQNSYSVGHSTAPNALWNATNYSDYSSTSTGFKYNYKSGGYYNYDVSGMDENGNYVYGNVDIDDDGNGYIVDEDGNEKYIDVEWTDWGVMEGYDEDGVWYELEVE